MTLEIKAEPHDLVAAVSLDSKTVTIGKYEIEMIDFLVFAWWVLTVRDLNRDDPRIQFVKGVGMMTEIQGYDPHKKRLDPETPCILPRAERVGT